MWEVDRVYSMESGANVSQHKSHELVKVGFESSAFVSKLNLLLRVYPLVKWKKVSTN